MEMLFGSSLALYNGLKQLDKDVDIIIPEYPKTFEFLASSNDIKKEGRDVRYDLAIALDCGDIKRLNGYKKKLDSNVNLTLLADNMLLEILEVKYLCK